MGDGHQWGLSSAVDSATIFKVLDQSIVSQVDCGAATTGSSFYWGYDSTGAMATASGGVVSTAGTFDGQTTCASTGQITGTGAGFNYGSPGSAMVSPMVVPEPSSIALCLIGLVGLMTKKACGLFLDPPAVEQR